MEVIRVNDALRAFQQSVHRCHQALEIPFDVTIDFEVPKEAIIDLPDGSPSGEFGRQAAEARHRGRLYDKYQVVNVSLRGVPDATAVLGCFVSVAPVRSGKERTW